MPLAKKLLSLAVPTTVAIVAFLHARAVGSLVDANIPGIDGQGRGLPFALAEARAATPPSARSADAILDRNPFDHENRSLRAPTSGTDSFVDSDPWAAPSCAGVRVSIATKAEDSGASIAALELEGKHVLRADGGDAFGRRVVAIAADRVWLESNGALCQARVFGDPAGAPATTTPAGPSAAPKRSALESEIAGKIVKTGDNEYAVDRGAVERILDAQAELMKVPLAPEKQGDKTIGVRLLRVRPESVVATLGLRQGDVLSTVNGVDLTDPAKLLEAYARLRSGTVDHLSLHVVRDGKPMNIDYVIR